MSSQHISIEAAERGVIFSHQARYPTGNGEDNLAIEITFDGTYTIKTTHTGPTKFGPYPEDTRYIRNIPHLPTSIMDMLTITGGYNCYNVHEIRAVLQQICSDTLEKEKKEIETNFESETIRQLRDELESSYKRNHELTSELARSSQFVLETQTKFYEIQDKNTELLDTLVDQLQKIGQLEDTNQELVQMVKSIEEQTLDTMLDSAFDELDI
jgi:hypothetical protein